MRRRRTWARSPKNVVMLTADAFGVLPPIARLTPDQAMYHFLSGYTAKVAGTEIGVTEPRGDLLDLLRRAVHAAPPVGLRQSAQGADRQGRRRLLAGQHRLDRRQIWRRQAHADQGDARAAQRRARRQPERTSSSAPIRISASRCRSRVPGVDTAILDPRGTWADKADYDRTAAKLVDLFVENFAQFADACRRGRAPSGAEAAQQQAQAPAAQTTPLKARSSIGPCQRTRSMTDYRPTTVRLRRRDRAHRRRPPRAHAAARGMDPRGAPRRDDLSAAAAGPTSPSTPSCPGIIRRYNESVGGVNSDTEGYHDTITRVFLHGVRLFLAEADPRRAAARARQRAAAVADGPARLAAALLYSRAALLGRGPPAFVQPDIAALP